MDRNDGRRGLTAVELLIVIVIVMILAGMTATALPRTLRAAAMGRAVTAVRETADRAHALALNAPADAQRTHVGVVLAADARACWVAVIRGQDGDGKADRDRVLDEALRLRLPPNVRIHVGADPLEDDKDISWYHEPGTGRTVARDGSGFSMPGATVGLPAPRLMEGGRAVVFGGQFAQHHALAPSVDSVPGLSLRSVDGRLRRSLAVTAAGTFHSAEF